MSTVDNLFNIVSNDFMRKLLLSLLSFPALFLDILK